MRNAPVVQARSTNSAMEKSLKLPNFKYETRSVVSKNSRGTHKIVYSDWKPKNHDANTANVLVCIHGLTGNGNDFDFLADKLTEENYRIIAIDLPGRGRSDFLQNPLDYNYDQYVTDINAVLSDLDLNKPKSIDWLGVSLGGLLGFMIAAEENSPIRRLIVNDVGPEVPQAALDFIYRVIKRTYTFNSLTDFENRLRATRGKFWGPMENMHWQHMAEHNHRTIKAGLIFKKDKITYAYDPKISHIFKTAPTGSEDLWQSWKKIDCPILVLRGENSLLLTHEGLEKMLKNPPKNSAINTHTFADCGHVPSLMQDDQILVIQNWLEQTSI